MVRVVGKEGALGGGGELQQRHGWLQKDNEVVYMCVFCFLLHYNGWCWYFYFRSLLRDDPSPARVAASYATINNYSA